MLRAISNGQKSICYLCAYKNFLSLENGHRIRLCNGYYDVLRSAHTCFYLEFFVFDCCRAIIGAAVGGVVTVVAAPLVVAGLGFGAGGIAAGSVAASMMSVAGNVAAGES